MIKVLIIEDEIPARNKLKRFLAEVDATVDIVAELDSVEKSVAFLNQSPPVDLIFSDVELLDGRAFDIYARVPVRCPIIFTTAYDQFWMNAFETNGIEYLLKPFSRERFDKAWQKFRLLQKNSDGEVLRQLSQLLGQTPVANVFKKRFTAQTNNGIYFVDTENITFFSADEGVIWAFDTNGKKHLLAETTLKIVESQLNPADFFKINRGEILHRQHIEKVERYSKNALSVKVKGSVQTLLTSQSTTSAFRDWLEA